MPHTIGPLLLSAGAMFALTLSSRYRLPERLLPAACLWGLWALAWPAFVPAVRTDDWDVATCALATVACAVAVSHASRTRFAQLHYGWCAELQRQLNERA